MAVVSRGVTSSSELQVGTLYLGNDTAPKLPALIWVPGAQPTATGVEGAANWNDTANCLETYDGTQWRKVPDRMNVIGHFNSATVDDSLLIADRAYKVLGVQWVWTVAGNDAGSVTGDVKKCTGTQAPSAGNTVLSATVNLKATANTVVTSSLTATGADLLLAAGDRLCLDVTGTLTTLAGGIVQITYEAV